MRKRFRLRSVVGVCGAACVAALAAAGTASASSGPVTVTSGAGIVINDNSPGTPYPSTVAVANGGLVGTVTVTLSGFEHTYLGDVVIDLVAPNGQSVPLLTRKVLSSGDVCGTYVFAAGATPFGTTSAGTVAGLCAGAPGWAPGTYGADGSLASLVGALASGNWSLFVRDQGPADVGAIKAWVLTILALYPDRAGYCAVEGNKDPYSGAPLKAGTFLNLVLEQVLNDSAYAGATIANYVDGVGITCDPVPAGFIRKGFAPDSLGVPANVYPFYAKG